MPNQSFNQIPDQSIQQIQIKSNKSHIKVEQFPYQSIKQFSNQSFKQIPNQTLKQNPQKELNNKRMMPKLKYQTVFLFLTTFKLETGERKVLIAKLCNFSPRAVLIPPLPLSSLTTFLQLNICGKNLIQHMYNSSIEV